MAGETHLGALVESAYERRDGEVTLVYEGRRIPASDRLDALRQLNDDPSAPRMIFLTMHADADLATEAKRALEAYVGDVREGRFPEEQHTYAIPDEELEAFEAWLALQQQVHPEHQER